MSPRTERKSRKVWRAGQPVDVAGAMGGERQRATVVEVRGFRILVEYRSTGAQIEVAASRLRAVEAQQ